MLRVFVNGVLRRTCRHKKEEILKSFITYTLHQILLGLSSEGERDQWDMWHIW